MSQLANGDTVIGATAKLQTPETASSHVRRTTG